ncbi:unnamed protein product [Vicia faba]|uniref:Serine aminopeptidase S33 domain-containing protein n=1 Tax=Vicia faba TaxID=3906 RepID=A0AAV1AZ22_VICFA|nr:unnamed protein product [Vicia faba]
MASVTIAFGVSPISTITTRTKSLRKTHHKLQAHEQPRNLDVLYSSSVSVEANQNGSVIKEVVKNKATSSLSSRVVVEDEEAGLAPLWDDGYGYRTVEDYFALSKEICNFDGGPPRWFCPIESTYPSNDSPTIMFLPGMDGTGFGLSLHHQALARFFEVRCLHIPVHDRTPFEGLVKLVEEAVKLEHALSPKKPIYLVGDSLGGCLALAVAARNPTVDLILILVNPATSFARSQLQPLLPILEAIPDELHVTVPFLLSFIMGEPLKMATVNIGNGLPPTKIIEQLSNNLTSLLPCLPELADIIPKDTLLWKIKLLKSAAAYTNSRLHAVRAEVLVLASGKDNMLPSVNEAQRLASTLKNCKIRIFKDNGHTLLLEDCIGLLTIIKGTCMYRRTRRHDLVMDFIPPSMTEFRYAMDQVVGLFRSVTGSVMFSTLENGKIVKGLSGVPDEVRKVFGGVPVSASNLFKLLSTKSHVLLYPGGAREALHFKGEEYKLIWPDQPEFVRMAARFGATIVPFGVVGEDDIAEIALDYNDLMKIPILNDYIKDLNRGSVKIRDEKSGEVANQNLSFPVLLPKIPGRFYYLFGKPIRMKGMENIVKDRENANELYLQIKSQVEKNIDYLIKKREEDPYRNLIDRKMYQAFYPSQTDQTPTFKP